MAITESGEIDAEQTAALRSAEAIVDEIHTQETNMRMQDKVALVTGSSVGIGEAIARRFAKEGAKVAINYKSNDEARTELSMG